MNVTALEIQSADPSEETSMTLVRGMEEEIDELYRDRPGSIRDISAEPAEMSPPGGDFVLILSGGEAVGCGGLKRLDDAACEIKRMYLLPEMRGRGLASSLLEALESRARALGYAVARLDTGDRQPSAKRLYENAGYLAIPDYNGNAVARFWFEKNL